jgi:hypothetical protein
MVPHFLDETMRKPMGHGLTRAFVHTINPIWTKRRDHVHFLKIFCLKKKWKCGCPNVLFISSSLSF